ncbi:MAG: peptide chain release factor N(5)-glutamine methyltransferase [Pseudomonadota bacterium]|nr:peptide chain release factor N(5)-glutamine methyltransferase [Pseudomonadota bacterium]
MSSVREWLADGARHLRGADARFETECLLCHVLGVSRAWLVAHADDEIDIAQGAIVDALLARRARGEPIAYLTGVRGFHALELKVTPDVLIPRPETELLVELALRRISIDTTGDIADLGTGSGAIALAIAKERPNVRVVAIDASEAALIVARNNAARLELHNIEFAQGNWYSALNEADRFDMIVANPPYIAEGDPHLSQGDLRFEPHAALVSGVDGLDAIRAIVRCARAHLREGGWLLFEHGFDHGQAARTLLEEHGYAEIFTAHDLEDRERVSAARSI